MAYKIRLWRALNGAPIPLLGPVTHSLRLTKVIGPTTKFNYPWESKTELDFSMCRLYAMTYCIYTFYTCCYQKP